jgi:hypothetical protein
LGDIYENASVQTPQERKIHFGQEDHVRIYSVQGLQNRLENAGFEVIVKKFQELPDDRFGFKPIEIILICKK